MTFGPIKKVQRTRCCPVCGCLARIGYPCPACGNPVGPPETFDECPRCGAPVRPGERCVKCGECAE